MFTMCTMVIFVFSACSCSISVFIWLMKHQTQSLRWFLSQWFWQMLKALLSVTLCCIIFNQSVPGLVTLECETNTHYFCVLSGHKKITIGCHPWLMQPDPQGPHYFGQVNPKNISDVWLSYSTRTTWLSFGNDRRHLIKLMNKHHLVCFMKWPVRLDFKRGTGTYSAFWMLCDLSLDYHCVSLPGRSLHASERETVGHVDIW